MKGYYIIIRGPLGVGKSTISKMVAEKLKGKYISMDSVLEENGLDKSSDGNGIPLENFIKADDLILNEARDIIMEGGVVVFDGNFYHKEQLDHIVENLGEPCYAFTLKSSVESCIERDKNRPNSYGEDAARAVHFMVSQFDYGQILDTEGRSIDEELAQIIAYLPTSNDIPKVINQ